MTSNFYSMYDAQGRIKNDPGDPETYMPDADWFARNADNPTLEDRVDRANENQQFGAAVGDPEEPQEPNEGGVNEAGDLKSSVEALRKEVNELKRLIRKDMAMKPNDWKDVQGARWQ